MGWESRLPAIVLGAETKAAVVIERTLSVIEAGCKERSRVDTRKMQEGWHTPPHDDPFEGTVENAVFWTTFNEYGTVHMSAQPMAVPAAEEQRPHFEAAMAEAYR